MIAAKSPEPTYPFTIGEPAELIIRGTIGEVDHRDLHRYGVRHGAGPAPGPGRSGYFTYCRTDDPSVTLRRAAAPLTETNLRYTIHPSSTSGLTHYPEYPNADDRPTIVVECDEEWGLGIFGWEFGWEKPDPQIEIRFLADAFTYPEARALVDQLVQLGKTTTLSDVVELLDKLGAERLPTPQS